MLEGFQPWPAEFAARYCEQGYWRGQTLGALLRERAAASPRSVALVDNSRRWSYGELDRRADRMAAGLRQAGIIPSDRVLVHLPNVGEFLVLCFALFRVGAIPVLALPAHRESEIVHLANLSGAVAYVIKDNHAGYDYRPLARRVCKQARSIRHVFVAGEPEEFVALSDVDGEPGEIPEVDASSVALLLLSGGTTGLPKLIPRTHDDYAYTARASAELCGLSAATRYLTALPIAHNFPLACPGILGTMYAGGTVVLCSTPSPEDAFPLIEREKVTITALVPPLVLLWLDAVQWQPANLSSLELLQVGGARLKAETAAAVTPTLHCKLQQVYGMAEGLLNFTRLNDDPALLLNTQGRPLADDDEIRIVNAEGAEVQPGDVGELLVRGPYTIRGYYRASDYNRIAFTPDGFYRSGDLVRRLPSGHLTVEGRIKDVINRGGDKVPVEEIENYLLGHPAVYEVAIVGVPDKTLGERTCACIIPRGNPPTQAELNAYLSNLGLAAFKLPDRLKVMDSFPRTSVGKINKQLLAEQVR
jgi:2,3-dihydroxybenzoate-AMP ligase